MRALALLSLVLFGTAGISATHAYEPPAFGPYLSSATPAADDTFAPLHSLEYRVPEFTSTSIVDRSVANTVSITLGDAWRLEARGSSFRPVEGMKLRNDGVYFARPVNEGLTVLAGVWRTKYSDGTRPQITIETVGISASLSLPIAPD